MYDLTCLFKTIIKVLANKRMCAIIIPYKDFHAYFEKTLFLVLSAH